MKMKFIKSEKDYQAALLRLGEVFDAEPGTEDGEEAWALTLLIESYEDEFHPIGLPDAKS